ncbi:MULTISPECIES: ATP-binding protein [unclassified Sphingobium]|uniref:PAS domain-containing sensor histidine kinase n=1 Tax=unclassified Sphingobium TaxID=2611147 RepID=UPI00119B7751|nr:MULTISPECIES: ATP-binding protein [unclassified Sphingobium]MBG6117702.1 PAS domain S-box-containing protein [Sphingobium sp. JAI105]TWD09972.1 PAS domain S-box-containing protein [Sphingobium sp. AEW010]TWD26643.1 PAS domain S-box-containing protein [Sphingobium sp. AEW013]TWD27588.1 PAS domain S-box-containing protein [Sphingobium sp. AEW001]
MDKRKGSPGEQAAANLRVDYFRQTLGPFVVAAETTRMAMIFTDALIEGHPIVFANDSFLALTGFDRATLLGKGIGFVLQQLADHNTLSSIKHALNSGTDGTWEAKCHCADGNEYLATVFLSPVRGNQGAIIQHFWSFVEVSGRIDRLLRQRGLFDKIYEQAPGFIATSEGKDHRFTFANESYRHLVGRDELVGYTVAEALPELADQGIVELLDKVFATGEPFIARNMPMRLMGDSCLKVHFLNFIYQPIRDERGAITGVFCEGYDVTAEREAAEKLSLLQDEVAHLSRVNAMGMMAATLAHELNQPLTAISNYVAGGIRLVDPDSRNAEALIGALEATQEAAQRAGEIIRNVRELTRRGETTKMSFDLGAAIAECVRLVRAGGCPDVPIDDQTAAGLSLFGDRIQIQQVIINLLRNGCEAARDSVKPCVVISASSKDDMVVVSVTDTGEGLSLEAAQNIFTWTDTSKSAGMGLGLSISRTIVEAHRGRIWLEKSGASGTQFCFSIPNGVSHG